MAEQHRNIRGGRDRAGRGRGFALEDNDRPHHRHQRDLEIAAKDRRIRELERDLKIATQQRRIRNLEHLLAEAKLDAGDIESFLITNNHSESRRIVPEGDEEDAEFETASTTEGNTEEDFIDWQLTEPVYDVYEEDVIDWQPTVPIYDDYEDDTEEEITYADFGESFVVQRILNTTVAEDEIIEIELVYDDYGDDDFEPVYDDYGDEGEKDDSWLRYNILPTECTRKGNICDDVTEEGSCEDMGTAVLPLLEKFVDMAPRKLPPGLPPEHTAYVKQINLEVQAQASTEQVSKQKKRAEFQLGEYNATGPLGVMYYTPYHGDRIEDRPTSSIEQDSRTNLFSVGEYDAKLASIKPADRLAMNKLKARSFKSYFDAINLHLHGSVGGGEEDWKKVALDRTTCWQTGLPVGRPDYLLADRTTSVDRSLFPRVPDTGPDNQPVFLLV